MKSLHSFALLLLAVTTAQAQTNTYPWPASGNVGIGTTTPNTLLDLGTTAGLKALIYGGSNGYQAGFGMNLGQSPNALSAVIGGATFNGYSSFEIVKGNQTNWPYSSYSTLLTVLSSGDVGIGTATPNAKLHVVSGDNRISSILATNNEGPGELRVRSYTTQPSIVPSFGIVHAFYNDERNGFIKFWRGGDTDGGFLTFGSNGTEYMRINPSGDVGIGTSNPDSPLVVSKSQDGDTRLRITNENSGNSARANITMQGQASNYQISVNNSYVQHYTPNGINMQFWTSGSERLRIDQAGNVGIGTTSPTEKLSVNGKIRAKEVIIETTGWSDHVFADSHQLQSLAEVEQHIKTEKHLPGVPSAQEVADKGVSLGDMQAILLAKIEELTLHQIAQEKEITRLRESETVLKAQVQQLQQKQ